MSAKVSVLIGVYNAAETLPKTLDSIAAQTFGDFEVVAVNDASTDRSQAVLERFRLRWGADKLRILTNPKNLGLTKSLNLGLKQVNSPYTARIDADDWWHKDKLRLQVDFLDRHPDYGILGSAYTNVGSRRKTIVQVPATDADIRRTIAQRNPFAHSCVMFRTKLVKKLGGYDPKVRYGQDYDLWFRSLDQTKLANLPENLCYRRTGSGISVDQQRAQMRQSLRTKIKYIQRYRMGWTNYLAIIEPLTVMITPNWLRQLKRRLLA